ncbi:MAG: tetratricopeptide repeat protein [Hyphomicrobiales bacterium]
MIHCFPLAARDRARMFLLLLLAGGCTQLHADEVSDCISGQPEKRVAACARIIETKTLFGGPIGREKLAMVYNNRGVGWHLLGQPGKALADFVAAISLNPLYAEPYFNRGAVKAAGGLLPEAIADYTAAIRLDSRMVHAYHNRGNAYRQRGDFKNAIADYTAAIALDPKLAFAYHNRGIAHEMAGQREKAIADYRKADELLPGKDIGSEGLKRLGAAPR